jgi:hypothetical protein
VEGPMSQSDSKKPDPALQKLKEEVEFAELMARRSEAKLRQLDAEERIRQLRTAKAERDQSRADKA